MFKGNQAARPQVSTAARFPIMFVASIAMVLFLAILPAGEAEAAGLTSGSALRTQASTYSLYVGGVQVTSANAGDVLGDGHVSYDASTQTLTLKNAKIKNGRLTGSNEKVLESISFGMSGTFTIKLSGKNTISAPKTSVVPGYAFGIADHASNTAKLKIIGSGSLTVRAADASRNSQAIAVWKSMVVQGKAKLNCSGGTSVLKSTGIEAMGGLTVKGSAQIVASGESGAFTKAPKFSGYTPKVKAGYSSKSIKVNKKKPTKKTYTKYPYVKITKASGSTGSATSKTKKPAKVKVTQLEKLSGQFLVHWNPLTKNCSGYELQVSEYKSFPSNLTRKYSKVTNKKYKGAYAWGLTPGTRYYVRVRAYYTTGGKTYWGAYSNVKSAVAIGSNSSLRFG